MRRRGGLLQITAHCPCWILSWGAPGTFPPGPRHLESTGSDPSVPTLTSLAPSHFQFLNQGVCLPLSFHTPRAAPQADFSSPGRLPFNLMHPVLLEEPP